jgi:hypothetical protein
MGVYGYNEMLWAKKDTNESDIRVEVYKCECMAGEISPICMDEHREAWRIWMGRRGIMLI